MAMGVASPWRGRSDPSARTQGGAEAEDGDRRSAQGEGADRRAGASGWSSTIGPRFFSQGLAACRRASGDAPGAWRDQLYALIKDLSAAEKSQGENETKSAPEKATHEVQHLCQLAQLSRAGYYRRLAPRETKRDDADIRDAIHRIALSDRFYGYRRIAEQLKREGLVVNCKRVRRLMRLDNLLSLRLSQIGAHASMSRPGTPQDNAKAESFMGTLKAEEVDGKAYRSREDAEGRIAAFIDDVYNARRLH